jgi:hypothetical protein
MDVDEFFAGQSEAKLIFDAVTAAASSLGPMTLRVSKSQIAFVRNKTFACVWIPGMYLRGKVAPLVLTFSFGERRLWPRWKEVYQVAPHRFTHHLELWSPGEVDEEVRGWLEQAWAADAREHRAPQLRVDGVPD